MGKRRGSRYARTGRAAALCAGAVTVALSLAVTGCGSEAPQEGFAVRHEEPAPGDRAGARLLERWRSDTGAVDRLNAYVDLPYRVTVLARSCAGEGTAYDPEARRIELCYDDLTEDAGRLTDEELADVVTETVFHEAGHALVDALDLPDRGDRAEEDAADGFARLMLLDQGARGEAALLAAARAYDLAAAADPEVDPRDEHAPDAERAEAHRCAVLGAAPARHPDLATPSRTACAETWSRTRDTWTRDLTPLLLHR
ncbi:DUF4344 domain-containing metallopeptidase [Streptomyces sp. NPDC091268]|uniref:DUF4344 domain-containing metallopeptidase n=1 Tax=Streptomyces sp. NPDC091268 TaxID=3365979 RepID=UPI00382A7B5B